MIRNLPLLSRSFVAALLAAFAVTLLPLALALVAALLHLDHLAERSRLATERATAFGTQTSTLRGALREAERSIRQAQVLGSREMRGAYEKQRDRILSASTALLEGVVGGPEQERALRDTEALVSRAMTENQPSLALIEFTTLNRLAAAAIETGERQRALDEAQLTQLPQQAWHGLVWIAAAALPLAAAFALLFAWRLGRPIRQLGNAMRRLGEGDLATPVVLRGPQDVAELAARLEWLRARLAQLEDARGRFLRSVSHDLKTPIAAIAEGAASLQERLYGPLTQGQRAVVGYICDNTERLLDRIDALLRGAQALPSLVGSRSAGPERFALGDLVQEVIEDQRLMLERRRLTCQLTGTLDAPVVGDAEGLRVVLDNLLSNAVKFSPEGGRIDIDIRVGAREIQLRVRDQGPGVALGESERIFSPGARGSAARSSGVRGSGHGLSIAREIAQAHGGRLHVEPGTGGAGFLLALPRVAAPEAATHA